jgi:hypothetical protein
MLTNQIAGTHPTWQCRIGGDFFPSTAANCEGQTIDGLIGYLIYPSSIHKPVTRRGFRHNPPGESPRPVMSTRVYPMIERQNTHSCCQECVIGFGSGEYAAVAWDGGKNDSLCAGGVRDSHLEFGVGPER